MFRTWRKEQSHLGGEDSPESTDSLRERTRLHIEQTIQFLDQLEKQIKLAQYNLGHDPDSWVSLARPCARLDLKLLDLQGITEELMQKLCRSR